MAGRLDETTRRFEFVSTDRDIPAPRPDTLVIVLDPAWTPPPEGRSDVRAARPLFGAVVERRDLFDEALERIDAWADRSHAVDRLLVDGVTYWFRVRETMWRWLHERLLWRYVLADLGAGDGAITYRIPRAEAALVDVAACLGAVDPEPAVSSPLDAPSDPLWVAAGRPASVARRLLRRLGRLVRSATGARTATTSRGAPSGVDLRLARLIERVERLRESGRPRVVVLTTPATHQRVASAAGRRDPVLGSVVDQLEQVGFEPVLMAMGTDPRRDEDWSVLAPDDRMLPQWLLGARWARPEDRARADLAVSTIGAAVGTLREVPLEVDGVDLTDPFALALREHLMHIIRNDVLQLTRVERFVAELRPRAIVLAQEGIRVPWLIAGRGAGVPVFAVQHGILYPGHPGYPHQRHSAVRRASRTFVYGTYERAMLLKRGAYLESEVEVSGSPRLDLDHGIVDAGPVGADAGSLADRLAVREELGVREGDRLLVVSTVNLPFVQRAHFAPMVDRLLGWALPRVHLVFKLHPGEREDGPYRELLTGLARARGHDAPPISVVRDVDLYRLLRAADAHLGLHSTVLTDAVAVGTPNLIAMVDTHADILAYVDAGVARPVRDVDELREALDPPIPPDPAARAAFLARHFLEGHAGGRIARSIRDAVDLTGVGSR